ncbi:hypothetical protein IKF74_02060 [Candidatus Saccharibacteria bacterium]|nr:hypothetical protein [Candidatus Saccharibacteria bacterium]
MNNNQTTAEDTTTEKTVTTPSESTTTTTSDSTVTDEKVTDTADETVDTTTTGDTDGVYNSTTASGPFVLKETFNALESVLTVESGDTFTATDVKSAVVLSNNRITNNDATSAFLRAQNSEITMTFGNQVAEGDIILDNLSTLTLALSNSSYYMGIINHANSAKSVTVNLDATSQLILAGDSYIDVLENADSTNQNIYSNGYKLYVAGQEVAVNGSAAPETPEVVIDGTAGKEESTEEATVEPASNSTSKPATDYTPFIVGGAALLVIILAIVAVIFHNKKKKDGPTQGDSVISPDGTMSTPGAPAGGRPDFSAFDDAPAQPSVQPQEPQEPQTPPPANPEPPVVPAAPASPATPQSPETPPRPRPPLVGAM